MSSPEPSRRWKAYRKLPGLNLMRRLSLTPIGIALCFVAYAWLFASLYSDGLYRAVEAGEWTHAEVQLQSGTYLGQDGTVPFEATFLGATSTAVFLYDPDSDRATVVPLENLASITID